MFCPQCGKRLAGTEKFCSSCGFNLAVSPNSVSTGSAAGARPATPGPTQQPARTSAPVVASELVTLTAALLIGIAALMPFLVSSGFGYDYSVALADAPDGTVLVFLAIATAVLSMVHKRVATLVLSSITTALALFEICSISLIMMRSTYSISYVDLGSGFGLLLVGIVVGIISIVLLSVDVRREKRERAWAMGTFIPANGNPPYQK
ncbi:zinc ribbon domain-containing protein [Olsenella sp. Marseille-P4559]|uniref:zinc ribbon domain-containing protein n=1 Tax=Olsenella sp. Marseille-P4559 TaxID=2364795 RepID=UPI0013EF522C|nr:zinc ribbon domain-containing protein [Olsenella sp. Marseille-P4559]